VKRNGACYFLRDVLGWRGCSPFAEEVEDEAGKESKTGETTDHASGYGSGL
jgi:hypothetical protein